MTGRLSVPCWLLSALAVAVCIAACGGGSSVRPRVTVSPPASVEDQSIHIRVRGLSPHEVVSLELASTDATRVRWVSRAKFAASSSGALDLTHSAPRSGAYTGVWPMGLLSMMHPVGKAPYGAYFWAGNRPMRFTLTIKAGDKALASTTLTRRFSRTALTTKSETLKRVSFVGRFVYPTTASGRPAVLLLSGSGGGIPSPLLSGILAAHGYPVLALGYFKLPGLPQRLLRIPLEYFEHALQWLRRQPQVDPNHIAVLGFSRGSEAALLSGAYFPRLVNAAIGMVPSDVANCSYPGCRGPAWTFHGHAVPFTNEWDTPHPADHPNAVIPVQRIRGPVFLACGTDDAVWTSCAYGRAIISHLNSVHDRFSHVLYAYPGAGHGVGFFIPYEPMTTGPYYTGVLGGTFEATQQAVARDWPRMLTFLAAFGHTT